jgi:membrane-anchored protein YejM (alkaline phosphatase superfamily)
MEQEQVSRRRLARFWAWLVLATIAEASLVALRYVAAAGPSGTALGGWLRALTIAGQLATLVPVLLAPVLLVALLWRRPRPVLVLAAVASALVLLFLLADSQVYRLYRFHLNAGVLGMVTGGAAAQIFVFPLQMWLQLVAAVLAVTGLQAGLVAWLWRRAGASRPRPRGRAIVAALACVILPYQLAHAWADAAGFTPLTRDATLLPLAYPLRARGAFDRLGLRLRQQDWRLDVADPADAYPLDTPRCTPPAARPDILLIVIDSWRFDALSPEVTPNVWRLGRDAARFDNHFSGGNATRAGIFSLFYGIPATYWHHMLQQHRGPVLVPALLDAGYEIGIFASASLRSPEFSDTVFVRVPDLRIGSDGDTVTARDEDLTADFRRFLAGRDASRPYFAFLFYDAPHAYALPDDFPRVFQPSLEQVNYLALGPDTDRTPLFNRYLNSVRYVDSLVGEVLGDLREAGKLDSSVILVTGDHGQEFNDNGLGYWGHDSNFTRYQTEVPLLVHGPGFAAGDHTGRTSHFDVAPTLMTRYLGCTTPPERYSVGRDLLAPGGRERLVMGSYQDFAVMEADRFIVVRKTGVEVLDPTWRPLQDDRPWTGAMEQAIEQNSRFRTRRPAGG